MKQWQVEKFARVLLKVGLNLQPGQTVVLQTETGALDLAREINRQAFEMGAADVITMMDDPVISHYRLKYASSDELKDLPEWKKESMDYYLRRHGAQIGVMSSHPTINHDVDPEHLKAYGWSANEFRNVVRKRINEGSIPWVGSCWPSEEWAQAVWPDLAPEEAYQKLEEAILAMMRIDEDSDPVDNWKKHCDELAERSKKLNDYNFKSLHLETEFGTDLTMDLVEGHIWESAGTMYPDSKLPPYVANMPTEEVFTDPDYRSVNGIVHASLPLFMSGRLVKNFWIRFENGRAVDCGADENQEMLEHALYASERTRYLGEVALVSRRSPIRQYGVVFQNGLIDENAACHLAFGQSFASNIKGGLAMSRQELLDHGVNLAESHNDFMWGSDDTKVTGTTHDGKEIVVMEHGDFVI